MEQSQDMKAPEVGSSVRVTSKVSVAPKPGPKNNAPRSIVVARRSIVATLPDDTGCISLVQDDLAPEPLRRMGKFLIAPMFLSVGVEVKECEAMASDVMPLLEFEQVDHTEEVAAIEEVTILVQKFKDYGDQLFRLNDFTGAISHYEAALHFVSSKFNEIGGTLVVRRGGHSVIAEVDCVEKDHQKNSQYDVTYLSGEEATIHQKEILLAVWTNDVSFLQTKVLLNLSRCLLKLAEVDATRGNASCAGERRPSSKNSRQERYRLAGVLGCSIAISLCEYRASGSSDDDSTTTELLSLTEKARVIRSRAFLGLRKLTNATVDVKKVLARNSANREAQALLSEIKATEAYKKSVDKKLSKEVCRWVQTATSSSSGAEAMERTGGSI